MTDILSLEQLVHLSLGDPEAGAVNFNVLKTLLLQMLKAMNLFNHKPAMSDQDQRTINEALTTRSSSTTPTRTVSKFDQDDSVSQLDESDDVHSEKKRKSRRRKHDRNQDRLATLEEKVSRFESQVGALNKIPSNAELIARAVQISKNVSDEDHSSKATTRHGPILEVWQYTQLEKRLESAENGVTRLATLLQDLITDMNDLKESQETIKQTTDELKRQQDELKSTVDTINKDKNNWAKKSDVENLDEKIRNLQNLLTSLHDRLNELSKKNDDLVPMPDLSGFVTWDRLEDALKGIRESLEKSSNDAAAALASSQDRRPAVQLVERQSQTSAKRKDGDEGQRRPLSGESSSSSIPSNSLAALLEQLGTLNDRHEQLRALVEALERNKLNRDEFDAFKNQKNGLFDRLAAVQQDVPKSKADTSSHTTFIETIKEVPSQQGTNAYGDVSDFRTIVQRLRDDVDRLKQLVQDLINKGNLSPQDIDALKKSIEQLDQLKADKTTVNNELDKKADKRDLDKRVLKSDFSTACNELSQNINDCMQQFNVHDDTQKKDLEKITSDVDGKADRTELASLRDRLQKQLRELKKLLATAQPSQPQMMTEDEAAGLRKQLIHFHCISCDRPIDVRPHLHQQSLPGNQGMRPIQSPRPYTTYELDQIRQYQKSQQFSNEFSGGVADVYATIRQCGGSHTSALPSKRQTKTPSAVPEETLVSKNEVDIRGQNGVLYRGRLDVSRLPPVEMQKKNSAVFLTTRSSPPPPPPRSRSSSHSISAQHHEFSANNDQEANNTSSMIPNLQPVIPREQTFT